MWKSIKVLFLIIAAILAAISVAFILSTENLSQLGASPKGAKLERMKQSPNFDGKVFINPIETNLSFNFGAYYEMTKKWLFGKEIREPKGMIPIVQLDSTSFKTDSSESLRITWMGHSSVLIEIDGKRILTDPIWSERCSPSSLAGPKRFHPVPIELGQLPQLDAVLISHDHADHLDKHAVCTLAETGVKFFVPLGVAAHLNKWGIDSRQIVLFDWWDSYDLDDSGFQLIATPARHFSGRRIFSGYNSTLWVSWVIVGPKHRVFFSGDTGAFPGLAEIGEKFGPFNLTMIKSGAYSDLWPDIHLNPEQTVKAHLALRGNVLLPIHWGTFNLAFHDWFEPPNRLLAAASEKNVQCIIPRPGQIVSFSNLPPVERWWEAIQ
jgi:L-ascorbate metabolism protein UlaG (beta-lactamase superfamily)